MSEELMRLQDKVWDHDQTAEAQDAMVAPETTKTVTVDGETPGGGEGTALASNLKKLRHASEQNNRLERQVEALKRANAKAEAAAARAELYVMEVMSIRIRIRNHIRI